MFGLNTIFYGAVLEHKSSDCYDLGSHSKRTSDRRSLVISFVFLESGSCMLLLGLCILSDTLRTLPSLPGKVLTTVANGQ